MKQKRVRRIGATHFYFVIVFADGTRKRTDYQLPIRTKRWHVSAVQWTLRKHHPGAFAYIVTFKVKGHSPAVASA